MYFDFVIISFKKLVANLDSLNSVSGTYTVGENLLLKVVL